MGPGAEVEELVDALLDAPAHDAAEEVAVEAADAGHVGVRRHDLRGLRPVAREVVGAAEEEVVDAGGVGPLEVDALLGEGHHAGQVRPDPRRSVVLIAHTALPLAGAHQYRIF